VFQDRDGIREASLTLFDTGSAIAFAFSAADQAGFQPPIPVNVHGILVDTFYGPAVGDASAPGTIIVAGRSIPNGRAFLGTQSGSPYVPTLAGMVILNGSPAVAALMDANGGVQFVDPSNSLNIRVPVDLVDPPSEPSLTLSQRPVKRGVSIVRGSHELDNLNALLDTGAQGTVITEAEARALGIRVPGELGHLNGSGIDPICEFPTNGTNGQPQDCGDSTIDRLAMDTDTDRPLWFTGVQLIIAQSLPAGVDVIVGTNVLTATGEFEVNPNDPRGSSVSLDGSGDGTGGGYSNLSLFVQQFANGLANTVSGAGISVLTYNSAGANGLMFQTSDNSTNRYSTNNPATMDQVAESHVTFPDFHRQAIDRFHQSSSERSADIPGQEILSTLGGMEGLSPNDAI
jgi:hypothetical protein